MSYLLTEIAMEMLGWRFYDADGVARPINFEGTNNGVCEGVENLAVSLGIQTLDNNNEEEAPSVVKSDISSHAPCHTTEIIDLDIESTAESDNEEPSCSRKISKANINEPSVSGQQKAETPQAANSNISGNPFTIKIQNVQGGYNATTQETSTDDKTQIRSLVKSSIETIRSPNTKETSQHLHSAESSISVPAVIDLTEDDVSPKNEMDIRKQLEIEIEKIATDLNRQKTIFFQAIPEVLKHPLPIFQGVLRSYREQEIKNLENELRNLQTLREEAELKSYSIFEDNYTKYLNIFNQLSRSTKEDSVSSLDPIENAETNTATTSRDRKQVARKKTSPRS